MSDDRNENLQAIPDDELDEVSGGTNAKEVAAQAAADGRTVMLPAFNFSVSCLCICAKHNKWANHLEISNGETKWFFDVKCYKCGKVWDKVEFNDIMHYNLG